LTDANRAALAHVAANAERSCRNGIERIDRVLRDGGVGVDAHDLLDAAGAAGSVTLNFHPDRLLADGRSVAQALHDDGEYRNQFETGISNGGLSASGSRIDAANIGSASVSVISDPRHWQSWGEPAEVLTHLKDLWLILLTHGRTDI
jgi:hypothetical protein